jgi:hypothetical protein
MPSTPLRLLPSVVACCAAVSLGGPLAAQPKAPGYLGWKFGMTADQVRKVAGCRPYQVEKTTGGLECPGYSFLGAKRELAFYFDVSKKLVKITIQAYEGKDEARVAKEWKALLAFLKKTYGPLESPTLQSPESLSEPDLVKAANGLRASGMPVAKLQFKPKESPKAHFTFGTLAYSREHDYFYLFLYFQPPR